LVEISLGIGRIDTANEDNKESGAKNQLRRSKNLVHLTPSFSPNQYLPLKLSPFQARSTRPAWASNLGEGENHRIP
jgi:hypothetical protein